MEMFIGLELKKKSLNKQTVNLLISRLPRKLINLINKYFLYY